MIIATGAGTVYRIDERRICGLLQPSVLVEYLERLGWSSGLSKRRDAAVMQAYRDGKIYQITIPLKRYMADYEDTILDAIEAAAMYSRISREELLLGLLEPETDRVRYGERLVTGRLRKH